MLSNTSLRLIKSSAFLPKPFQAPGFIFDEQTQSSQIPLWVCEGVLRNIAKAQKHLHNSLLVRRQLLLYIVLYFPLHAVLYIACKHLFTCNCMCWIVHLSWLITLSQTVKPVYIGIASWWLYIHQLYVLELIESIIILIASILVTLFFFLLSKLSFRHRYVIRDNLISFWDS